MQTLIKYWLTNNVMTRNFDAVKKFVPAEWYSDEKLCTLVDSVLSLQYFFPQSPQ